MEAVGGGPTGVLVEGWFGVMIHRTVPKHLVSTFSSFCDRELCLVGVHTLHCDPSRRYQEKIESGMF